MGDKYQNEFLETLSESYYSPDKKIFGNDSMDVAIFNVVTTFSKEKIEENNLDSVYNLYLEYKGNVKKDIKKYLFYIENVVNTINPLAKPEVKEVVKRNIMTKILNNKKYQELLISSRIRKELFGNHINKNYNTVYDFFKKFNGKTEEKLSKSLEYIFTNYPDKEAFNVMDESLFYFFIKEKSKLEDMKFDNFYKHAAGLIIDFQKMDANKRDYKMLGVASFFKSEHYTKYLEGKNIHCELDEDSDDSDDDTYNEYDGGYCDGYNDGYSSGREDGYGVGYGDAAEGLDYNNPNDNEDDDNEDEDDEKIK